MNWTIKTKPTVLYHLSFWSVIWLFYFFFLSYKSNELTYSLSIATLLLPITILPSYVMIFTILPKYLQTKKYLQFGIYTLCILLFTVFFILLMFFLGIAYIDHIKFEDLPLMSRNYAYLTILVLLVVALVSFLNTYRKSVKIKVENQELQNQLLNAKFKAKEQELTYLKNQIHPHFLFNALNTIYGLALKKSVDTSDMILKLSDLLDYTLYQTDKPNVQLTDEIEHLEKYIALERIRFKDSLNISFTKEIIPQEISMAPMLLLPFVENAFKHGSRIDGLLNIELHLSSTDQALHFSIRNTYKQNAILERGLGIKNVRERLAILYPNHHNLKIMSNTNWFEVQLTIENFH